MRDFRAEGFRPWPVPGRAYTADCYPPKGALLILDASDWDKPRVDDLVGSKPYVMLRSKMNGIQVWWKPTGIAREEMGWE